MGGKWVRSTGVSAAHAPEDLLQACRQAVREAPPLPSSLKRKAAGSIIGTWTSATVAAEWSYLEWPVSSADLENSAECGSFSLPETMLWK